MPKKKTLDNKPANREQDPMALRKRALKASSTRLKIKRTGLKKTYCQKCEKTYPIGNFTIHKTGSPKRKSTKQRKNTPSVLYKPRKICNKCLMEKKKDSGQYDKNKAKKREVYATDTKSRKALRDAAIRARALLSDSYIRKLLKALGYTTEQIKDDPSLITKKRKEVKDKRKSAADKTYETRKKTGFYAKRERAQLGTAYLKRLIKRSKSYKGGRITKQMLAKKKAELLEDRATGNKPWIVRKTPEQKRATIKATSDRRTQVLDNVYIRQCIRHSVGYNGEEITDEMIEVHRAQIEAFRDKKKSGVKRVPSSIQLTDGYVRNLVSMSKGIPKEQVTEEQIVARRAEVIARRNKIAQKRVDKKKRIELRFQKEEQRKEARVLEYKQALTQAAERRRKKLARIEAKQAKIRARQAIKDAKTAKIKEEQERAAAIALKEKLLRASEKHEELLRKKQTQQQKEEERLQIKEAKKKAKAAAKKVKRLAKKADKAKKVPNVPVYSFFTPLEIRR